MKPVSRVIEFTFIRLYVYVLNVILSDKFTYTV